MKNQDGRLRIDVFSQPLFIEAIKTLPFSPRLSDIMLVAKGEGIIPNSQIKLEYDSPAGFLPKSFESFRFTEPSHNNMNGLIMGGRVKDIRLHIRGEEGFANFRDSLLPVCINNQYDLFMGDLWLSTEYSSQHYMEGDYRTGGLRFDAGYISRFKGLELEIDYESDKDKIKQLEKWFNQLSKKYK